MNAVLDNKLGATFDMRRDESPVSPSKSVMSSSLFGCPRVIKACLRWALVSRLVLIVIGCIVLLSTTILPTQLQDKFALAQVRKKPKLFLHIGAHKTATTYIQTKMVQSRDFLMQRGIILPTGCSRDEKSFHAVPMQLQGRKIEGMKYCTEDPLSELTTILDTIHRDNASQNIFISSESYDNLNDEMVAKLTKLFSNFQTTVVLYHRRKQEHIVSYYSQFSAMRNPLTSSLYFSDFLGDIMAEVDPEAGVSDPLPTLPTIFGPISVNGLCYNRVLETYGRNFGPENMVIVHYNGVMGAQKDPWEVLVQEVMELEMEEDTTIDEGDGGSLQEGRKLTKLNTSLTPFSLSTADLFYRWRWGNLTVQTTTSATASPLPAQEPAHIAGATRVPGILCVAPLLKPLEDLLPKQCFDLKALASLWEAQERRGLNDMAKKGSRLLYFDWAKDASGDMRVVFNDVSSSLPCQVHLEQLLEEHGENVLKTIPTRFLPAFEQVAAKVDEQCK